MTVAFHIFTLAIPLAIYYLLGCHSVKEQSVKESSIKKDPVPSTPLKNMQPISPKPAGINDAVLKLYQQALEYNASKLADPKDPLFDPIDPSHLLIHVSSLDLHHTLYKKESRANNEEFSEEFSNDFQALFDSEKIYQQNKAQASLKKDFLNTQIPIDQNAIAALDEKLKSDLESLKNLYIGLQGKVKDKYRQLLAAKFST